MAEVPYPGKCDLPFVNCPLPLLIANLKKADEQESLAATNRQWEEANKAKIEVERLKRMLDNFNSANQQIINESCPDCPLTNPNYY